MLVLLVYGPCLHTRHAIAVCLVSDMADYFRLSCPLNIGAGTWVEGIPVLRTCGLQGTGADTE